MSAFDLYHVLSVGEDIYDRSFKYDLFLFCHATSERGETYPEQVKSHTLLFYCQELNSNQ